MKNLNIDFVYAFEQRKNKECNCGENNRNNDIIAICPVTEDGRPDNQKKRCRCCVSCHSKCKDKRASNFLKEFELNEKLYNRRT